MKKLILIFALFSISITLTGCDNDYTTISMLNYEIEGLEVNDFSHASMIIIEDSITDKGLTIHINYSGDNECFTGSPFILYYYEDSKWNEVSYIVDGPILWTEEAYIIEKNQPREILVNWEWLYGTLQVGRYLIVKQITDYVSSDDRDTYYLACEFSI